MLNSNDSTDEQKQEKILMLKYTYEQVLASQVEQIENKANNLDNLNSFGKLLGKEFGNINKDNNLKAILNLYKRLKAIGSRGIGYIYFSY